MSSTVSVGGDGHMGGHDLEGVVQSGPASGRASGRASGPASDLGDDLGDTPMKDFGDDHMKDFRDDPASDLANNHEDQSNAKTLLDRGDIIAKYGHKISTDPIKKVKIHRDRANRATVEQVLDPRTWRSLAKIFNTGVITKINGCISTGKEANVYHGEREEDAKGGSEEDEGVEENETTNKSFLKEDGIYERVENDDLYGNNKCDSINHETTMDREIANMTLKDDKHLDLADAILKADEHLDLDDATPNNDNILEQGRENKELLPCKEYALKIYKTAILVFKDRERYVDGEFRFRNAKNNHNSYLMVKIWAEKEFRNLKRLAHYGIPCPEPVMLKSHILVMEYLTRGAGQPLPKLRDHPFKDIDEIVHYYHQMLYYMRRLYQDCRLVHADLSEYNSIVHNDVLYIIDVSQLVEPEHPMALDFLRMDIKNVNDFFSRKSINVYPERHLFRYITDDASLLGINDNLDEELARYLDGISLKITADDHAEDEVFRSLHLVRSLNHLDERDFKKFQEGQVDTLTDLVENQGAEREVGGLGSDSDSEGGSGSGSDSESDDDDDVEWAHKPVILKGKKHEDKDDKKARKDAAKTAKQEKRKVKMKKHIKKKIVNKRKAK